MRSSWRGKPGDPIMCHIRTLLSAYASRPGLTGRSSDGISCGCSQPTVRLPVVDMMLVIDRTRPGAPSAIVWTIMPPIDTPTRWAEVMPRWSSRPKASPARSSSEYGACRLRPAKASTSIRRVTLPRAREDRPTSRLSKRTT